MPRVSFTKIPRIHIPRIPMPPRFVLRPRGPKSVKPYTFENDVPPDSWTGTQPEWWVYQWLLHRGLVVGPDFETFQGILGPRRTLFGIEADFLIHRGAWAQATMVWRVQGYYWHFLHGYASALQDAKEKVQLERQGYVVIDLIDLDLVDPKQRDTVLEAALAGIDLSSVSAHIFSPFQMAGSHA